MTLERCEVEADLRHEAGRSAPAAPAGAGPATAGGPSAAGVRPEEVLDKLTQRIAERLRTELAAELKARPLEPTSWKWFACVTAISFLNGHASVNLAEQTGALVCSRVCILSLQSMPTEITFSVAPQSETATAVNAIDKLQQQQQLETFLVKEIESHTCPICYELMVAPDHSPMLLFPCGHTFCSSCIRTHTGASTRSTCPFCREPIASKVRCAVCWLLTRQGLLTTASFAARCAALLYICEAKPSS